MTTSAEFVRDHAIWQLTEMHPELAGKKDKMLLIINEIHTLRPDLNVSGPIAAIVELILLKRSDLTDQASIATFLKTLVTERPLDAGEKTCLTDEYLHSVYGWMDSPVPDGYVVRPGEQWRRPNYPKLPGLTP
jgi:hypothetical protein